MKDKQTLTPLEKLKIDKERAQRLCKRQETALNDDISYIQNNMTGIIMSSLSGMLFPKKNTSPTKAPQATSKKTAPKTPSHALSFADIIPVAKSMLPIMWDIARPMIISWGIKQLSHRIKKML